MERDYICSNHPNIKATHICTIKNCQNNLICSYCIMQHDPFHVKRFIVIDSYLPEESLENKTKQKRDKMIEKLNDNIKVIDHRYLKQLDLINISIDSAKTNILNKLDKLKDELTRHLSEKIPYKYLPETKDLLECIMQTDITDDLSLIQKAKIIGELEDKYFPKCDSMVDSKILSSVISHFDRGGINRIVDKFYESVDKFISEESYMSSIYEGKKDKGGKLEPDILKHENKQSLPSSNKGKVKNPFLCE
jgi:hypothetical protein